MMMVMMALFLAITRVTSGIGASAWRGLLGHRGQGTGKGDHCDEEERFEWCHTGNDTIGRMKVTRNQRQELANP